MQFFRASQGHSGLPSRQLSGPAPIRPAILQLPVPGRPAAIIPVMQAALTSPQAASMHQRSTTAAQAQGSEPLSPASHALAAKALSSHNHGQAVSPTTHGGRLSNMHDDDTCCVVCMERDRDSVLVPCGHLALCMTCSEAVQAKRNEVSSCWVAHACALHVT